jgi:LysM repeat protein
MRMRKRVITLLPLLLLTACTTTNAAPPAPTAVIAPSEPPASITVPAAVTTTPEALPHLIHTVQEGDTLLGVAIQYGLSLEELQAANPGAVPELLQIGEMLTVPLSVDSPLLDMAIADQAPTRFISCAEGCTIPPDSSCGIKADIESNGARIYHLPNSAEYTKTLVNVEEGDRWFCTPEEAEAAGFRLPSR